MLHKRGVVVHQSLEETARKEGALPTVNLAYQVTLNPTAT